MTEPDPSTELGLIRLFGPAEDYVLHSPVPLHMGRDAGGRADLLVFKGFVEGTLFVTSDLLASADQPAGSTYQRYELAIAVRKVEADWGARFLSQLAAYTLSHAVSAGETMSIESALPHDSTLCAVLFCDFGALGGGHAGDARGVIGVIGITSAELAFKRQHGGTALQEELRKADIYPLTELKRASIS